MKTLLRVLLKNCKSQENTGGSPECVDESCGIVVEQNDIDGMKFLSDT